MSEDTQAAAGQVASPEEQAKIDAEKVEAEKVAAEAKAAEEKAKADAEGAADGNVGQATADQSGNAAGQTA